MHLIFCFSFYFIEGGNTSIRGSDIRVDILLDNFLRYKIFTNNFYINKKFLSAFYI